MRIRNPIIIIGAPRSGTTLLFSILSSHPELWSVYSESGFLEKYLAPEKVGWQMGNLVGPELASDRMREKLVAEFYSRAINYQALFPNNYSRIYVHHSRERMMRKLLQLTIFTLYKPKTIRLVEKTPRNSLRIPFLNAVFPDAHFVFLTRDPRANISSLLEGWRKPNRYETYALPTRIAIPDYDGSRWNFLLPPGWQDYVSGKRLVEVCAFQYRTANQIALESLEHIPESRKTIVKYEALVTHSQRTVEQLCHSLNLPYCGGTRHMAEEMPPVNAHSEPRLDKWRKNEEAILGVLESARDIAHWLGYNV